ncbi:SCO7613 C-terminal domain-containing membrane protein, partial [Streptomyces ardesiacus]
LGGGALALVTLHELAPYLAQVVGALPRWVPLALAGLLLLVLGATYEQRLREARRLRDALGRLR